MYNILIIAKDEKPFIHLINLLRRDFLNVYTYPSIEMANANDELRQFDFILLLIESEQDVKTIIEIKNHCICPLYVFSSDHEPSRITHYLESVSEGHVEIPFKPEVVAPRIKAVLRFLHQVRRGVPNTLRYGRLTLHLDNHEVLIDDNKIPLTKVEFKIIQILVEHREAVVSKDKIIHHVWNEDTSATDNALGIHITRLRKKLTCKPDQDLIETVWGLGYRLNLEQCEK